MAAAVIGLVCSAAALVTIASPVPAKELTAKQILEKAARHYDPVKDYTVDARLTVESPSLHVPEMKVKIYFKRPDKIQVESKDGFAVLPKQGVIMGDPLRDLMTGTELTLAGSEKVLEQDCYVIKGTSKREGRIMQSTVWIGKKDWLVRQIYANPDWGPSMKVKLWYSKVQKRYWLPTTTAAQVTLPPIPGQESQGKSNPGKPTIITIRFSNYRINTGLSDKIFQEQEGSK